MLKIGKAQREALDSAFATQYARDVARYVRAEHADAVRDLDEVELLRRVTLGIARAEAHGLTWDAAITGFVAIMFEVSPTFDEQPAIGQVLADARIPADMRIDALWERTTDQDWEEAARTGADAGAFWSSSPRGLAH